MIALAQPRYLNEEQRKQHERWKEARARMAVSSRRIAEQTPKLRLVEALVEPAAPVRKPAPAITGVFGSSSFSVQRFILATSKRRMSPEILNEVAREYGLHVADLKGPRRFRPLVLPRQIAMWRLHRERPDLSLPAIGRIMGGRDHTTALHAVRKINRLIASGELVLPEGWGRAPDAA